MAVAQHRPFLALIEAQHRDVRPAVPRADELHTVVAEDEGEDDRMNNAAEGRVWVTAFPLDGVPRDARLRVASGEAVLDVQQEVSVAWDLDHVTEELWFHADDTRLAIQLDHSHELVEVQRLRLPRHEQEELPVGGELVAEGIAIFPSGQSLLHEDGELVLEEFLCGYRRSRSDDSLVCLGGNDEPFGFGHLVWSPGVLV